MGETVEAILKANLLTKKFIVSSPEVTTGYDLLCDWDGVINRLQVRSTYCLTKRNGKRDYYKVRTHRKLGNYSILVVYTIPEDTCWFIPWDIAKEKYTIYIPKGYPCPYDEYKENYEILKTTH